MTQLRTISQDSVNIIKKYINDVRRQMIISEPYKQLMVSLYAKSTNCSNEIVDILSDYNVDIESFITEENLVTLQAEYAEVIRFCYENDGKDGILISHHSESLKLPSELVELCMAIADCKPGSSVYLPFAGEGKFAFNHPNCLYEGFEINQRAWAISQIFLSSQNIKADITLGDGRVMSDESSFKQKKYDYIFSFPPFFTGKEQKTIINTLLYLAKYALVDNGKMFCILPMSFCFDSLGWNDLRKIISDRAGQYSALVISLPSMFIPVTAISTCLFYLSKNGKGNVMLMDATDKSFQALKDEVGYKKSTLKVQSILETIKKQDEQFVWVGCAQDLTDDLNMTPSRYLIPKYLPKLQAGEKMVRIKDLVEFVPGVRKGKEEKESALLGMKELSFNYLNCTITKDSVPMKSNLANLGSARMTQDCLLAGFIGNKFKVGKISGLDEYNSVALRPEVLAFTLKSNDITDDFLLRSILSESCTTQAIAMSSGVVISRLNIKDFANIQISVPSLEKQEQLCKEDTRASLTEADRKQLESAEEFRKDVHMKKHAIGQTLFNLNNWWKVLQKARKEGNGIVADSAIVGKINKIPVTDIYENLQQTIIKLQQQISKFDVGYGMQIENIPLTTFIEEYIDKHQSPLFKFIYYDKDHHAKQDLPEVNAEQSKAIFTGEYILKVGDPLEYAKFAPEALTTVFDNIISNACCYGFSGRDSGKNFIRIELKLEGDDYVITIANNGEPINNEISPEDVFTYGRTSQNGNNHFGIGGYEIRKLMREFGGDAELLIDSNDEFCVSYKLTLHDTRVITF